MSKRFKIDRNDLPYDAFVADPSYLVPYEEDSGQRVRILVAMQREADCLGVHCEVIGIGGEDIPDISPDDIIVNVGYCGGYKVPVGTICEPWASASLTEGKTIKLQHRFQGDCIPLPCFTSDTFVTEPAMEAPAIYDMELWKLTKIPCRALYVLKIVSDNLDEADCESFSDEEAWGKVRTLLKGENLI